MSAEAWGISDGSAGMVAQLRGLLEALGMPYALKRCERRKMFAWLPNSLCGDALKQLTADSDALHAPWPKLVVTCGRRSAPLGLAIRAASGGAVKAVHIGDPQGKNDAYDLIVAMRHDHLNAPNVVATRYSLHAITPLALEQARQKFFPQLTGRQMPFITLLIGGSTNKYRFGKAAQNAVIGVIEQLLAHTAGTLLISASRRTGEAFENKLKQRYAGFKRVWIAERGEHNPYLGFLACADFIVVTNDSVNMMSEALATEKPLYVLPLPGHAHTKPERFARGLVEEGLAREFSLPLATWPVPDCCEAARVALEVRKKVLGA